jgi:hypothetical protein
MPYVRMHMTLFAAVLAAASYITLRKRRGCARSAGLDAAQNPERPHETLRRRYRPRLGRRERREPSHIARLAGAHRLPGTLAEVRRLEALALRQLTVIPCEGYRKLIAAAKRAGGLACLYNSLIYYAVRLGWDSVAVALHFGMTPTAVRQALWRLNNEAHSLLAGKLPFTKRKYAAVGQRSSAGPARGWRDR